MQLVATVNEASKHWETYSTDYGFACKYCSDKAREKSENKNIFIMLPCLESEAILKQMQEPRIEIPESPCPDGDTCKRVNGRIKHDRFCDNINHRDED